MLVYIQGMAIGYDQAETEDGGDRDYARVAEAIAFLQRKQQRQPGLEELAAHLRLSESQTQRLFSRWAGISPKRFLQFLTVEHAKRLMGETSDLLGLTLDSGLSGTGRLHDLFVNMEAMSPGEFRRAASGMEIRYGVGETPFGMGLIASTSRGICHLSFVEAGQQASAVAALLSNWPDAQLIHDPVLAQQSLRDVFRADRLTDESRLSLWISGTNFQIQVWRALLKVPFGGMLSYQQLAASLGRPRAARGVGTAVAANPVAYLIPCHRILRGSGEFGVYHWGTPRKAALCGWECATHESRQIDRSSTEEID